MNQASFRPLVPAVIAMIGVVVASNVAVQYPFAPFGLADWLTWGAFTYPIAFLVTDLTNRRFGAAATRNVVYVGFALAVVLSVVAAGWRIAFASGTAFLIAQLLDVFVFDRLRKAAWWQAPLASSLLGSAVDTALFFSLAFAYTGLPWHTWAMGDFAAKLIMAAALLLPFRAAMRWIAPQPAAAR